MVYFSFSVHFSSVVFSVCAEDVQQSDFYIQYGERKKTKWEEMSKTYLKYSYAMQVIIIYDKDEDNLNICIVRCKSSTEPQFSNFPSYSFVSYFVPTNQIRVFVYIAHKSDTFNRQNNRISIAYGIQVIKFNCMHFFFLDSTESRYELKIYRRTGNQQAAIRLAANKYCQLSSIWAINIKCGKQITIFIFN